MTTDIPRWLKPPVKSRDGGASRTYCDYCSCRIIAAKGRRSIDGNALMIFCSDACHRKWTGFMSSANPDSQVLTRAYVRSK